mgnify:CR=1 FL=1
MAATCAVCMAPIIKGVDKFAISGTEVIHARCVGAGATVGTRRKLRIIEQTQTIDNLRSEIGSHLVAAREERVRRAGVESREADYRRQRDEARRERDEAMAARDAAVREVGLRQALGIVARADPAPRTEVVPVPEQANDDRDASEIRFSLLEIDEP